MGYRPDQQIDQLIIVVHTLPMGSRIDGLLGMGFLGLVSARLSIAEGVIEVP